MSGRMKGITLVEVIMVICIASFLGATVYRVFNRQVTQANADSEASKYYLDLGMFIETLHNDLAMARVVNPTPDGMSLEVNPEGNPETIVYSKKGNQIERKFRGTARVFSFRNPNRQETPLVFRIEEDLP